MGHAGGVHAVAFSPDGKRLVTEAADNSGRIWDLEGSAEPRVLSDLSGPHAAIAFSPDGEWLVTEAGPTTAKVWSVNDPADTVRLTGHDGGLTKVSFNSDGTHILTASDDGTARVWRIGRSGGRRIVAPLAVLRGHKGSISTAAFTAGDQYVLTAGVDGTARLWDFDKEKEPVAVLRGHSHGILAASMSPDGTRIATASTDGKSRIWELIARSRAVVMNDSPDAGPGGTAGRTSGGPPAVTWQVAALTPGGEFLLGLRNGRPGLWRTSTGAARQIPTPTTVRAAVSSADGSLVAIAPRLSRIQIWDAASGQVIREVGVARPSTQLSVLAFSPSGKLLATRQTADLTRVWEVTSGREVATIPTDSGAVASSPMAFSPDDKLLVLSSRKRGATREQITASAQVWNLERRARVTELRGFLSTVLSLSFSADGRTILSASGDTVARVWNARTGQVLRKVRSKSEVIDFASPSPHGEVLLTVAYGHSVRLWEASTGTLLTEIHGLRADLMRATFGPDGRIVTVERGGTVRFVDCDVCGGPRELLAKASARLKRVEAAPAPVVASGQPPRR
jgi:WD40 repeat protein